MRPRLSRRRYVSVGTRLIVTSRPQFKSSHGREDWLQWSLDPPLSGRPQSTDGLRLSGRIDELL